MLTLYLFVVFILGLVAFITYLELIQKLAVHLFRKKKPLIEQPIDIEDIKPFEEPKPNLDSMRKEHKQQEQQRKEKLLEDAIGYTRTAFAPYATDENINRLYDYITDYYKSIQLNKSIQPVIVKDLSNGDLFHFGWNIWNHFKPIRNSKQDETAHFLKVVFARQLKDVDTDTIRKKLTFNEGKFKIKKLEKLFPE